MEEATKKKYSHLAVQFSINILIILIVSFVIQNIFIVKNVKSSSKADYSAFSEKVIAEDAGKIQYWNEVLVNEKTLLTGCFLTKKSEIHFLIMLCSVLQTELDIQVTEK